VELNRYCRSAIKKMPAARMNNVVVIKAPSLAAHDMNAP
jgi:hypothetical protein